MIPLIVPVGSFHHLPTGLSTIPGDGPYACMFDLCGQFLRQVQRVINEHVNVRSREGLHYLSPAEAALSCSFYAFSEDQAPESGIC